MHRARRLAVFGVLVGAASLALPFATLREVGTLNGVGAEAWPAMILLGPIALLFLLGDRFEAPPRPVTIIATVLATAGTAFSVIKVVDAGMAAADATGSIGPGAWALMGGAILALGGTILGFSRRI